MKYKIEDIFYTYKGIGKKYKCHIVGIVEGMIVYKWYGRHKQWWHYEIEPLYIIDIKKEQK